MASLHITGADLVSALRSATFGDLPPVKWVIDDETGEAIGWVRSLGRGAFPIEWGSGSFGGWEATEEKALTMIGAAVRSRRACESREARAWSAILALPEPLRTLRLKLETARVNVEIERQRNVSRPDDLARREAEFREAEATYAAAEITEPEVA